MGKCSTCAYSIFDYLWGEYKCEQFKTVIYDTDKRVNCEKFKQRPKDMEQKISKGIEEI